MYPESFCNSDTLGSASLDYGSNENLLGQFVTVNADGTGFTVAKLEGTTLDMSNNGQYTIWIDQATYDASDITTPTAL